MPRHRSEITPIAFSPKQHSILHVDVDIQDDAWEEVLADAPHSIFSVCELALQHTQLLQPIHEIELSVIFADNALVQQLNHDYRGKDKPTNVLSFPNCTFEPPHFLSSVPEHGHIVLGDIVLAYGVVHEEAKGADIPILHHIYHLLIHGTLHLLGYDHQEEKEADIMEKQEGLLLGRLNIASPYTGRVEQ